MAAQPTDRTMPHPPAGAHHRRMASTIPTDDRIRDDLATDERTLVEELSDYAAEAVRVTGTPGLNLALARRGRVIWEAGFGYADLAAGTPMTPATVSRAGSIAKIYTAIAFLQLVELGVLDLYDPVVQHLPSPRVVNPLGAREITIYDLLTFSSGLVRDTLEGRVEPIEPSSYVEAELRADLRREYGSRSSRWAAPVGEKYQYSSFGYAILARLFEEVSPGGLAVGEWVARHVLEPLSLSSTALPTIDDDLHLPAQIRRRRSTGYGRFGPVYVPSPEMYTGAYAGSGLYTTPGDQLRLLLALAAGGEIDGKRLLDPASVRRMLFPRGSASESERAFGNVTLNGIGVELANVGRPDQYFGRIGSYAWGWWHHARAYTAQELAIVVFTNKWDMQGWMNPDGRSAGALIADYASAALRRSSAVERPPRSWAWRYSYAVGLLMAERIAGLLGIPERLDAATIAQMGDETRVLFAGDDDPWDPDGFRAGAEDIAALEARPGVLRAFLASERLQVAPEELKLHWLRLGSHSRSPIPMGFYAAAVDEAERAGR